MQHSGSLGQCLNNFINELQQVLKALIKISEMKIIIFITKETAYNFPTNLSNKVKT